ncbi:MAG: dihydrodipicolinate synthase family protein [Planctomycetia bacterium]|nr:dihydrodipicolinate synthase family protein [Planctomycetia bacterium]
MRKAVTGGVFAVSVTPYFENGEVDLKAAAEIAQFCISAGCRGLFIAGSTGDMMLLDRRERSTLVQAARRVVPSDIVLLAGANETSVRATLEMVNSLADAGADYAVLTPPQGMKFSQNELEVWYLTLADKSRLPLFLYHHVHAVTPIAVETVVRLAQHNNIVGLKETGTDHDRFLALKESTRDENFMILQGCERFVPQSLAAGCRGTITALAAVWPEQAMAIWNANQLHKEEEILRQRVLQLKICEIFDFMPCDFSSSYFGYTLKQMLVWRGVLKNAYCRMPGFIPDSNYTSQLKEFLKGIGFPFS